MSEENNRWPHEATTGTTMALFPNFDRWKREYRKALDEWQKSQRERGGSNSGRKDPVNLGGPKGSSSSARDELVQSILKQLGPLGQIVGALLRPNGQTLAPDIQKELEAAQTLLEAIGAASKGRERIEEHKPRTESNPPPDSPGSRGLSTNSPDDGNSGPLREGPIPVTSSNVHSISYEWNPDDHSKPGNLLVRFLGGTGKNRGGPGSLYRYFSVPRAIFVAFKEAASKGSFLWSEVRVRGSISGTQFDYQLIGTGPDEYVPRQAGLKRGQKGEFFLQRSYQGRRSNLPERKIGSNTREELTPRFKQKSSSINLRAGRRGSTR